MRAFSHFHCVATQAATSSVRLRDSSADIDIGKITVRNLSVSGGRSWSVIIKIFRHRCASNLRFIWLHILCIRVLCINLIRDVHTKRNKVYVDKMSHSRRLSGILLNLGTVIGWVVPLWYIRVARSYRKLCNGIYTTEKKRTVRRRRKFLNRTLHTPNKPILHQSGPKVLNGIDEQRQMSQKFFGCAVLLSNANEYLHWRKTRRDDTTLWIFYADLLVQRWPLIVIIGNNNNIRSHKCWYFSIVAIFPLIVLYIISSGVEQWKWIIVFLYRRNAGTDLVVQSVICSLVISSNSWRSCCCFFERRPLCVRSCSSEPGYSGLLRQLFRRQQARSYCTNNYYCWRTHEVILTWILSVDDSEILYPSLPLQQWYWAND